MDSLFEIFLPADFQLNGLAGRMLTKTWHGVEYPQGILEYQYDNHWWLEVTVVPQHILGYLPAKLILNRIVGYCVHGDGLDRLSRCLPDDTQEYDLVALKFLHTVLDKAAEWAIVYQAGCDRIDYVKTGSIGDAHECLIDAIRTGRGFVFSNSE